MVCWSMNYNVPICRRTAPLFTRTTSVVYLVYLSGQHKWIASVWKLMEVDVDDSMSINTDPFLWIKPMTLEQVNRTPIITLVRYLNDSFQLPIKCTTKLIRTISYNTHSSVSCTFPTTIFLGVEFPAIYFVSVIATLFFIRTHSQDCNIWWNWKRSVKSLQDYNGSRKQHITLSLTWKGEL